MKITAWIIACIAGLGLLLASRAQPAAGQTLASQTLAGLTLKRVVMVSRHGIRSPTQSPEALEQATGRPWPAWPVAPGELTAHGGEALRRMGVYLHEVYAADGLLPRSGCPARPRVVVWADGADHRTRQSGQILADALAPGCGLTAGHGADGQVDAMFDAIKAGVDPIDPPRARAAVLARTDDGADVVDPAARAALDRLQAIVAPRACSDGQGLCLAGPVQVTLGKTGVKLAGPLSLGATLAENLLLEYTQGLPAKEVGWGQAGSDAAIAAVMPAHEREADLLRRTPYLAAHNGAVMAQTIIDLLQGRAPSDPAAPPLPASATVVMIAGHDTNLSNMAGVFGLHWSLPGEPDSTAPDTTLAFELWRDAADARLVRVVVYYQTLDQLRRLTPLDAANPAGSVVVEPAGCPPRPDHLCRLETLVAIGRGALATDPAAPALRRTAAQRGAMTDPRAPGVAPPRRDLGTTSVQRD